MNTRKVYLGDGVYASFDGHQIRLTTEYGTGQATNEIYLEPSVYHSLAQFAASLTQENEAAGEAASK